MTSFSSSTVEIRQRAGASSGRPKPSTSGPRISCAGPDLVDRTATSGALTGLTDVNGQVVVPTGGQLKVPTLRGF